MRARAEEKRKKKDNGQKLVHEIFEIEPKDKTTKTMLKSSPSMLLGVTATTSRKPLMKGFSMNETTSQLVSSGFYASLPVSYQDCREQSRIHG